MPQSVRVAISLGAPDRKTGNVQNDSSSNKNNESQLPPAISQVGQGVITSESPTSRVSLKSPHQNPMGGGQQMQPNKPTKKQEMGRDYGAASQIHNNQHHHHMTTIPAPSFPPIKRTKKIAKPKNKAKPNAKFKSRVPSSNRRKLPTKKNKEANGSRATDTKPNPLPLKTPSFNSKKRGEPSANANVVPQKMPPQAQGKDGHTKPNETKTKYKRTKALPSKNKSPRKRAKKETSVEGKKRESSSAKKEKEASTTKEDKVAPQESPPTASNEQPLSFPFTISEDSHIEKLASAVGDMVADEISYCASVFGIKPPKIVLFNFDNSSDEKSSSGEPTAKSSKNFTGARDPEESKSSERQSNSSNQLDKNQGASKNVDFSVKISREGTIHPVKKSAQNLVVKASGNLNDSKGLTKSESSEQVIESSSSKASDVQTLVFAVKKFVLEVYCPFLLSAKNNTGNNSPSADRICASTLLAIREMMIMNAEKLFTFSSLKQVSGTRGNRDKTYLSHVFANAIVRNTAKRYQSLQPESHFFADFVQATQSYDSSSYEFQFSLDQADVRSEYAYPGGEKVGEEESVLAKVSFNYAMTRHPLLQTKNLALKGDGQLGVTQKEKSLSPPAPTACAAFYIDVEAVAASDEIEDNDDATILEKLKQMFRRTRKLK